MCVRVRVCVTEADRVVLEVCHGSALVLSCPPGSLIRLRAVRLADSDCYGRGNCCPRPGDCSAAASPQYVRHAQRQCDDQPACSLRAEMTRIPCGLWPVNNDYQRVVYSCIGEKNPIIYSID